MTMTISQQAMDDLQQEIEATAQVDPFDPLDVTWHYPPAMGQGCSLLPAGWANPAR